MTLLRFGVENHGSIRDEAEISFVSTAQGDEPAWRIPSGLRLARYGVLPVLGIYGANASGKSSLLDALWNLREFVARSFTDLGPTADIPGNPWVASTGATQYELDFVMAGVRYQYGVAFTRQAVQREWLDAWPERQPRALFTREQQVISFGPSVRGLKKPIEAATRPNASLLAAAAQFNHPQLLQVYEAISDGIRYRRAEHGAHGVPLFTPDSPLLSERHHPTVRRLLKAADVGVCDLAARPVKAPEREGSWHEIRLTHQTDAGRVEFAPAQESDGTHAFLVRLSDILDVLVEGGVLLYDEFDTSLHPDLCAALLGLFTNPRANVQGAQLIFTTHDRDLLSALRRDEVILTEKDASGATQVVSAADFRDLKKRDDLRRVHSEGRLGGVPVLEDLATIVEDMHG